MKKTLITNSSLLLISLCFISCSNSKEKKLITDYVQTMGDTKIELNVNILDFEKESEIKAIDSLNILKPYLETEKNEKISEFKVKIESANERINEYNKDILKPENNYASLKKIYLDFIEDAKNDVDFNKKAIELYEGDCKGTYLEKTLNEIKRYEKNPNLVIANKYKTRYSIINPLLNNAKQELKKTFYINPDATKVLSME